MGNKSIPSEVKDIGIELMDHGWSISDICSILHVSKASLYRWHNLFKEYGSTKPLPAPLCGHPQVIGLAIMDAIQDVFRRNPDTYLDELQWYLTVNHNVAIPISTLQQSLACAGLTSRLMKKIAIERDECIQVQVRYTWEAIEHSNVFIRGNCYTLIAALSVKGYIATCVIPDSADTFQFFDFIVEDVLTQMTPYLNQNSILIMDNCRIHHTDMLLDLCNEVGMYYIHSLHVALLLISLSRHHATLSPCLLS
ncbi:hypothetical protein GYMLUDRAFT_78400 [Collybiopsis luxurians FD-317 M1]|uniref:Tc1-like transposase DDE domain-containing protein n=1 Tax=Collybiopsis luxurians FD-317 M1 TaxID=944289 RepID=A0A0D0C7V5_9AGAR|nr:hypothetical protein GYMLUDRAFT_78400 [Collybiopsis luxurians FD-317 M1]